MNIFLDTISPKNALILFDNHRNIISQYFFDVRLNESTLLIEEFDWFLKKNNLNYFDLENIVVVVWPGSFTGVRTTVLLVNTINFVIWKSLTALTYFDLFQHYPIIKASSKRDSFVKFSQNGEIQVIQNDMLHDCIGENTLYWDVIIENKITMSEVLYQDIIQKIIFQSHKKVEPFYCKKPNIS